MQKTTRGTRKWLSVRMARALCAAFIWVESIFA